MGGVEVRAVMAILSLALVPALAFADFLELGPSPAQGPYPGFDVRYSLDPGTDPRSLLAKPVMTFSSIVLFEQASSHEARMEGIGESQAIIDLPISALACVLEAQNGSEGWLPGNFVSRVESKKGQETLLYQESGASFLGVKVAFEYRILQVRDALPGGAVGFRSRVIESLDGKVFKSLASWYLAPIVVDGASRTYVRYFMRSGIRRPFLGEDAVLRAFMPIQLSNMIKANVKEARRRLGQGS
jgi:hypothetical protein